MPSTEVTLFQKNLKMGLNPLLQAKLGSEKSAFMIFPEYFFIDANTTNFSEAQELSKTGINWLVELSNSYNGVIIGGTIIREDNGNLYNSSPIVYNGQVVDYYNKRNLSDNEKDELTAGDSPGEFLLNSTRFSIMVRDDINHKQYLDELKESGIKLVFVPYYSEVFADDSQEKKTMRDLKNFIETCKEYDVTFVKCSGIGQVFNKALQGRSLICTPNGITWRVGSEEEEKEIIKNLTVIYSR